MTAFGSNVMNDFKTNSFETNAFLMKDQEREEEELLEFDVQGDVAYRRDNSRSKLFGVLTVSSPKNVDKMSPVRKATGIPMGEIQNRSQKHFVYNSGASSRMNRKDCPVVTGTKIITPQIRENSSNLRVCSEREKSLNEEYLIQYLKGLESSGKIRKVDSIRRLDFVVDTPGLVGYIEDLKNRGLIRSSFTIPTYSRTSRVFGDPNLQLTSMDSGISIKTSNLSSFESSFSKSRETTKIIEDRNFKGTPEDLPSSANESPDKPSSRDFFDLTSAVEDATEDNLQSEKLELLSTQERLLAEAPTLKRDMSFEREEATTLKGKADLQRRRSRTFAVFKTFNPPIEEKEVPMSVSLPNFDGKKEKNLESPPIEYRLSKLPKEVEETEEDVKRTYRLVKKEKIYPEVSVPKKSDPVFFNNKALFQNPQVVASRKTSVINTKDMELFRRKSSIAVSELSEDSMEKTVRINRELKKRLEDLKSDIRTDADKFGKKVDSEVKQKMEELERQRRLEAARIARKRKDELERLKKIAATGVIQRAFHDDKIGKKKLNRATKTLQSWFRGFLLRKQLETAKKQAAVAFGDFNQFYKHYFILMRKIQKFYDVTDYQINPSMKELSSYLEQRREYETAIRFVIGRKGTFVRPPQLDMALNKLGKYPCSQEIQRAILQALQPAEDAPYESYSCFMKVSVRDALDACFFIYVPSNIGLNPSKVRLSTWMAPIVNGIEVKKYLSDPEFIPERKVSYERCLDAVMNMMFEQKLKPPDVIFGPDAFRRITEERKKVKAIQITPN